MGAPYEGLTPFLQAVKSPIARANFLPPSLNNDLTSADFQFDYKTPNPEQYYFDPIPSYDFQSLADRGMIQSGAINQTFVSNVIATAVEDAGTQAGTIADDSLGTVKLTASAYDELGPRRNLRQIESYTWLGQLGTAQGTVTAEPFFQALNGGTHIYNYSVYIVNLTDPTSVGILKTGNGTVVGTSSFEVGTTSPGIVCGSTDVFLVTQNIIYKNVYGGWASINTRIRRNGLLFPGLNSEGPAEVYGYDYGTASIGG